MRGTDRRRWAALARYALAPVKVLAFLMVLGGCTVAQTVTVHVARTAIVGTNVIDLMGCAGKPDSVTALDADELLVQYDEKTVGNASSSTYTIALPFGMTVKLGAVTGECHAHFRVFRDGTVAAVGFSGPILADAAAVCSGLVSECLMHPDQTQLPKGYDAFVAMAPLMSKAK